MTEKTAQECVYQALTELGRRRAGEAPDATDYQEVLAYHEPLIAQLSAESIINIDDPDAVALDVWAPYCRLLAVAASGLFGTAATANLIGRVNADNINQLEARERKTLQRISSNRPTYQPVKNEFF